MMPSPDPLGYPIFPALLQGLSYLTLTLHFLAMNFTVGGAILAIALRLSGRSGSDGPVGFLSAGLPLGFSYLVTFGVPPLLFVQVIYGQLFYSSSVIVGAFWIAVIPALILAYASLYYHKLAAPGRAYVQTAAVGVALLLMLFVGFVYANNLTLVQTPGKWLAMYSSHPGGGSLDLSDPTVVPRWAFFILPGVAVAGLSLILRGAFLERRGRTEDGRRSRRTGARAMAAGLGLGLLAGGFLVATLPPHVRSVVTGGGVPTALACAAAGLAVLSTALGIVSTSRRGLSSPVASALAWAGAVACIVALRDLVRLAYLEGSFSPGDVPINAQWGMLAVFLASLAAGILLLSILAVRVLRGMIAARPAS